MIPYRIMGKHENETEEIERFKDRKPAALRITELRAEQGLALGRYWFLWLARVRRAARSA